MEKKVGREIRKWRETKEGKQYTERHKERGREIGRRVRVKGGGYGCFTLIL